MSAISPNPDLSNPSKLIGLFQQGGMFPAACLAIIVEAMLIVRAPIVPIHLSISIILAIMVGMMCLNSLIHLSTFHLWNPRAHWFSRFVWIMPSLITLETMILITQHAANDQIVGLVWLILFAFEISWWVIPMRKHQIQTDGQPARQTIGMVGLPAHENQRSTVSIAEQPAGVIGEDSEDPDMEEMGSLDQQARQSWTRYADETGESIAALQRILFEPGQRHQTLHFSFVPSLPVIPSINTTIMEGPPATIQIGEAQTFGARLELKLSQAYDEPVELVLQIEVIAQRPVAA